MDLSTGAASFEAGPINTLKQVISEVRSSSKFCVGGKAPFPCLPGLRINGVGEISMPLLPVQASAIKQVATQAPFGKGTETVVDTNVRNTLEIEAAKVVISSSAWIKALQDLLSSVCEDLGIEAKHVQSELYKVLLYEKGGHFKSHRDTEKAKGMFGTLVVQFPSAYEGGTFQVRHGGITQSFNLGIDDLSSSQEHHFVAFYADCEHEIKEVTDGFRLVAVYSLCWKDAGVLPSPPDVKHPLLLADNLKCIGAKCLGVILAHEYTHDSLSRYGWRAFKGIDRALAGCLFTANAIMKEEIESNELVFHIAKVTGYFVHWTHRATYPELDFYSIYDVYGAHLTKEKAKGSRLESLDLFDDVLNVERQELAERENDFTYDKRSDEVCKEEDPWWVTAIYWPGVEEHGYYGNEPGEDGTTYSSYILTMWRKDA